MQKIGQEAINCPEKNEKASIAEEINYLAGKCPNPSLCIDPGEKNDKSCLDSGCTSYLSNDKETSNEFTALEHHKLNLASNTSTEVKTKGTVQIKTSDGKTEKDSEKYQ